MMEAFGGEKLNIACIIPRNSLYLEYFCDMRNDEPDWLTCGESLVITKKANVECRFMVGFLK